jgi:1,4-dihydroxy-2-naphthoate polyprenyltransferase
MTNKLTSFVKLSRIQFVLPGILPFTLGAIAGWKKYNTFNVNLFLLCFFGIILIMVMGFLTNEYVDYEVDKRNKSSTQFSGGSKVLIENKLPRKTALISGIIFGFIFVIFIGTTYFIFFYNVYPKLVYFGLLGLIIGIAYGNPPFKLSYKGFGEILTALGCGYLAVVTGYYISAVNIDLTPLLLSIPPALTVFCLAFINAYPDIESDKIGGKMTLPARFGIDKMNYVFIASIVISDIFLLINPSLIPMSKFAYFLVLPTLFISFLSIKHLISKKDRSIVYFEKISIYSLILMVLASITQILAFII